jgi:hypothetical protein
MLIESCDNFYTKNSIKIITTYCCGFGFGIRSLENGDGISLANTEKTEMSLKRISNQIYDSFI